MTPSCRTIDPGTGEKLTSPPSTSTRNIRLWSREASLAVMLTVSRGSIRPRGRGPAASSLTRPPTLCPDKARELRATRGRETGLRPEPRGHRVTETAYRARPVAGGGCPRFRGLSATSGSPHQTMTAPRPRGSAATPGPGRGATATPASWRR